MTVSKLGGLHEYRCHTGHRFGLKSLIAEKRSAVENSLDAALAQSEELTALLDLALAESSDPAELNRLRGEVEERKHEQDTLRMLAGMRRRVHAEP